MSSGGLIIFQQEYDSRVRSILHAENYQFTTCQIHLKHKLESKNKEREPAVGTYPVNIIWFHLLVELVVQVFILALINCFLGISVSSYSLRPILSIAS